MARVDLDPVGLAKVTAMPEVQSALHILASGIAATARGNAPRRTGALAESIVVIHDGPKVIVGTPRAPHAHLIEFGTATRPAQPFLEPAAHASGADFDPGDADDEGSA